MVFVDQVITIKPKGLYAQKFGNRWCHLWADNRDELIKFGKQIGLNEKWIQGGLLTHFDLTERKRSVALQHGAVESSLQDWFRKNPPLKRSNS